MTKKCKCGGKYRRSDLIPIKVVINGQVYDGTKDANPLVAHWRCDQCGQECTQKKRQPKKK